jgi:hypothetical protein
VKNLKKKKNWHIGKVWVSLPMHQCEGLEYNLKLGEKYYF